MWFKLLQYAKQERTADRSSDPCLTILDTPDYDVIQPLQLTLVRAFFVLQKMKPVVRNLKDLARTHDLLLIWTDCDREGEHIGWEVLVHCQAGNPRIRVLRSKFSAIIPA